MFAKKQILTAGLLVASLAVVASQANAQSQLQLVPSATAAQPLITTQAGPVQGQLRGQPYIGGQYGAYSLGNTQPYQYGYQVTAPATSYGYATQQPLVTQPYVQTYAQPRVQYSYSQPQYAYTRYAPTQYAQTAVRYGYVQQYQQPYVTTGATYQQRYSAYLRPNLPQPTVITKTYRTQGGQSYTTTTGSSAPKNIVPYNECVAGCQEACSQNQSFLSHCVRACGDLVKLTAENQTKVNWKNAGIQTGQAVIAAYGRQ